MDLKTYVKISALNLLFLLTGLVLGIAFGRGVIAVHAQTKDAQAQVKESVPLKVEPSVRIERDPNAEYVTAAISLGGPVVTNTLLANKIASDSLQVNGYEPLRLNDAILSALVKKGVFTQADVRSIVEAGKAEHALRVRPQ